MKYSIVTRIYTEILINQAVDNFTSSRFRESRIYHEKIEYPYDAKKKKEMIKVSDIDTILDCDYKGYKNNIGNVINPISILWSLDQGRTVQDYIKIMSVVGSITIDYAKHGEEAGIPKEIIKLLKKHRKPYFMKYLRSGRKKRSQEKELKKIGAVAESDIDTELFDDTGCTMNRICHYVEKCIGNTGMDIHIEDEFHWENLLPYIPDITSHRYKKLRDKLEEMQDWLYEINNDRYKDTDDSDEAAKENNRNYDALYELVHRILNNE